MIRRRRIGLGDAHIPSRRRSKEAKLVNLTDTQRRAYERDGYLFLPSLFPSAEAAVLRAEADRLYATEREEVWRESSGAPRTAFPPMSGRNRSAASAAIPA